MNKILISLFLSTLCVSLLFCFLWVCFAFPLIGLTIGLSIFAIAVIIILANAIYNIL